MPFVSYEEQSMADKREQIHLEVEPEIRSLLQAAAEAAGESSLADYILRTAIRQAQEDLPGKRTFLLDETAWKEFMAQLDAPPRDISELRALRDCSNGVFRNR